jgi:hypothetical protein
MLEDGVKPPSPQVHPANWVLLAMLVQWTISLDTYGLTTQRRNGTPVAGAAYPVVDATLIVVADPVVVPLVVVFVVGPVITM